MALSPRLFSRGWGMLNFRDKPWKGFRTVWPTRVRRMHGIDIRARADDPFWRNGGIYSHG